MNLLGVMAESEGGERRPLSALLFTRNLNLSDTFTRRRNSLSHCKIIPQSDYESAVQRIQLAYVNERKRIDAMITDGEPVSLKLVEYVNQQISSHMIVCVIILDPSTEPEIQERISKFSGVNLICHQNTPFLKIISLLEESVHKVNQVDKVFKDLNEIHFEREFPFIPVFQMNAKQLYEVPKYKKALDFSSKADLDIHRFIVKPKKTHRATTVIGLEKKRAQHFWREYIGNKTSPESIRNSMERRISVEELTFDHISRVNSSASIPISMSDRDSVANSAIHSTENVDKLKYQQMMKQNILLLSESIPPNIFIGDIVDVDLYALKMNLAERDLLEKGIRYQRKSNT